jgi:hypothetical protein
MKKALTIICLTAVCLALTGCDRSSVKTKDWDVKLDRLMTDRSFDEVQVRIDPNGVVFFTMKKFKSESQKLADIAEVLAGAAVGAGI